MLDFVGRCPTDRTLSIGGDARVVAPMALSWLERAEASHRAHGRPDPHHATKLVEADKHAKYDQLCQLLNPPLRCLPAVFSDFGGIGRELYSAIIQPHFQQLYEAEVEEGKSGWAARRAKQRWLQHTSVPGTNRLPARGSSAVWVVLSLKLLSKQKKQTPCQVRALACAVELPVRTHSVQIAFAVRVACSETSSAFGSCVTRNDSCEPVMA